MHQLGDGLSGFLEGLEDANREAAKTGHVFLTEADPDATAVLVIVQVDQVMDAFDAPMSAVDRQYALR